MTKAILVLIEQRRYMRHRIPMESVTKPVVGITQVSPFL